MVDVDALNWSVTNLASGNLLTKLVSTCAQHVYHAGAKANDNLVFTAPVHLSSLAVVSGEVEHEVILSLRLEVEDRFWSANCSTNFLGLGRILVRAPLDCFEIVLGDERFVHGVSLMITHSYETVLRTSDQVTILVPVTDNDFLTVFRDARNLAVCFPVEEHDGTLF